MSDQRVLALENESAELRALTARLQIDLSAARKRELERRRVKLDAGARDALRRPYRGQ